MSEKKSKIQIFENLESFLESKIIVDYCIIGVASAGGILPVEMRNDVKNALKNNLSIINGLHSLLSKDNELSRIAKENNVKIHDIRVSKPRDELNFWSGKIYDVKSTKIVVLGTDCGLGKRTTAKLVVEALNKRKIESDMIYAGQTGWMQGRTWLF